MDKNLLKVFRGLINGDLAWPLFLDGSAGCGKTCAALALTDYVGPQNHLEWSRHGPNANYYTVRRLCGDIIHRQTMGDEYENIGKLWGRIDRACIAVLDELGSRKEVSDFHYETVCEHLDRRLFKPAIYISNLSLDDLAKLYDDRVCSRLASGTVLNLVGKDRRVFH